LANVLWEKPFAGAFGYEQNKRMNKEMNAIKNITYTYMSHTHEYVFTVTENNFNYPSW
jgi:hypothetical protein